MDVGNCAVVLIALALILIVLIQKGRGGGVGAAFGGGGANSLLGTKTGDFLTWVTISLVALFLVMAVVMGKFMRPDGSSNLVDHRRADTTANARRLKSCSRYAAAAGRAGRRCCRRRGQAAVEGAAEKLPKPLRRPQQKHRASPVAPVDSRRPRFKINPLGVCP